MLRRRPYFLHPCGRLLYLKLPLPSPQVLLYFLVATSSLPVMSAGIPLDEITYIFQSVRTNRRSQSVQCSFSFPLGTRVTYITWEVIIHLKWMQSPHRLTNVYIRGAQPCSWRSTFMQSSVPTLIKHTCL